MGHRESGHQISLSHEASINEPWSKPRVSKRILTLTTWMYRAGSQPIHCSMLAATLGITGHRTSANQSDRSQRHAGGVEELRQSILTSGVDQIAILIHIHGDGTGRWSAGKLTQKNLQHTDWTTSEADPVEKHARWIG